MTGRLLLALLLCLPLPAAGAPLPPDTSPYPVPKLGLLPAGADLFTNATAAHYTGRLGTTSVHGKLTTILGQRVAGTLLLPSSSFTLAGTRDTSGQLTLAVLAGEQSDHPADTPAVTARIVGSFSHGDDRFTGNWQAAGGEILPLTLMRTAVYGTFTGSEGRIGDSPARFISLEYPQLAVPTAAALNEALFSRARRDCFRVLDAAARATDSAASGPATDCRLRRTLIWHADESVVAMLTLEYSAAGRPVRPGHAWLTENYSLTGASTRRIELPDLFRAGTPWVARLSSLVRDALARQGADAGSPVFVAGDLQAFLISPAGLSFWFNPGAVADENAGDFRVTVPWLELADLIDRDGPAARFLSTNY